MAMSREIGIKTQTVPSMLTARREGTSYCINCGEFLAFCGKPFTDKIACEKCGVINVFENSQQPSSLSPRKQ
jgi:hypothetical protein